MSEAMLIQPFATQLARILMENERNASIFDIHQSLFYRPRANSPHAVPNLFGRYLATPVGPSAGPHTQLSQNIVSAFLCGGRFMELKTVQLQDRLTIPRPCIDMTDEGYNVEWSQELTLEDSAHEYVVAWALVHILPRLLGWDGDALPPDRLPGVIFDMSVGYDFDGITHPRMQHFMDVLADASEPLSVIQACVRREFPQFADINIPTRIVNSVTLSTMHGCPPNEIEKIARHLLRERELHTVVKLNPTLLGAEAVRDIVNRQLGFAEITIPDSVFEHDLKWDAAVDLVSALRREGEARGLTFGVKLSNTLATANHTGRLPGDQMYMSGRALYPVTMQLFDRVTQTFGGDLHVSFSAGVDAANVATVLSCGALPVTGCTDLLKPGGYGRMADWIDNIDRALDEAGCASLAAFAGNRSDNVGRAASDALSHPRYKNGAFAHGLPKVETGLGAWDCVVAPCVAACAVEQDVPEYAWLIAQGDYDRALEVILARNPLPGATGYACTRLCETKCTRNDYEATVAIRALKRIASERGSTRYVASRAAASGRRVAIVGAGPSGLAAAAFLAINGVSVTVFESSDVAGGMLRAIPPFRLPSAVIDRDIERITELGVTIQLRTPVTDPPEAMLQAGFDAVYLAAGFQRATPLRVPGIDGPGVIVALDLLDRARRGLPVGLGQRVVVIGGGDTAMDAARTAQRLGGHPVTIVYRRSRAEMPAAPEELEGAFEEGNTLEELVTPLEILRSGDTITGVRCVRNRLDAPGPDGRPVPRPVAGSEFIVPCDTVVVAVGQLPELSFLDGSGVTRHAGGGVTVDDSTGCAGIASVYAGGDMVVEPASIIAACADGRRAAEGICTRFGIDFTPPASRPAGLSNQEILEVKRTRTRRVAPQIQPLTPPLDRKGFALVESTMSDESARLEALRCVQCTTFCDKCVEVCPNRSNYTCFITPVQWQLPLLVTNGGRVVVAGHERFTVSQPRQIVHVDDFCNECDNCQTFCVHRGRPYADKPRLFLDEHAFAADAGLAFHIAGETIRRRDNGAESRLTACADGWTFEDEHASLRVSREWSLLAATLKAPFAGTRSLRPAADMAVLYEGVMSTLPFLTIGR